MALEIGSIRNMKEKRPVGPTNGYMYRVVVWTFSSFSKQKPEAAAAHWPQNKRRRNLTPWVVWVD